MALPLSLCGNYVLLCRLFLIGHSVPRTGGKVDSIGAVCYENSKYISLGGYLFEHTNQAPIGSVQIENQPTKARPFFASSGKRTKHNNLGLESACRRT
jgi:hypothetical protein